MNNKNIDDYLDKIQREFNVSKKDRALFEKIINTNTERREYILECINKLIKNVSLSYALLCLYRQQVNSGFVLTDPLVAKNKEEKAFFDHKTGINFRLQWNPDRELRKNHSLLIERGVIRNNIDKTKLINIDKTGKPCYLDKVNIDLQNPGEILLQIILADEKFYIGANFAYITNNHFTLMNAEHKSQLYRKETLEISNDFIHKTNGYFRVIFNGLAGASIKEHEHFQVTTDEFPIEKINIEKKDIVYEDNDYRISQPRYYLPVWIVEGLEKTKIEIAGHEIIELWHSLDKQNHTENIISTKINNSYRTFVILRDKRKLTGTGRKGGMAAFETGGNIVLSYRPTRYAEGEIDEKKTFENANLETVKNLLKQISPNSISVSKLHKIIAFPDMKI